MAIKTAKELASAAERVARGYKTLYVTGCIGSPMTEANKQRYINQNSKNRQAERKAMILAASADTFGFDCVCFIKSLLWGWSGDASKTYGGASYCSGGVPDIDESAMIAACHDVSTDFSHIEVGEIVWMPGHIGIYIGNGLVAECSPKWANGVQITAVANMGQQQGYNGRTWDKHGKLPYVAYEPQKAEEKVETCATGQLPILQSGSRGNSVKALQILLIGNKYSCGAYGADGIFGQATDYAVRRFQREHGLVSNGICDCSTWQNLLGIE